MNMVSRLLTNNQLETLNRQQKRTLQREHEKAFTRLQRLTDKTNLPVTFDNHTVTSYGNFGLFETFKKAIDFTGFLKKHFTVKRHHNCRYTAAELADIMSDCIALGLIRFEHMNALKSDLGYQKLKDIDRVPDERTYRYLIEKLSAEDIQKLKAVNQAILQLKADMEKPREIWLDCDDSVITVFGTQKGAEKGYNPRYHGRNSYKVKVAFVSQTCELINAELYGGTTHSNGGFLEFFKDTVSMLGPQTVVKGVRLDKGFFDEKNFIHFEDNSIEYVCKAKLNSNVRKLINYVNEQKSWRKLDNTYAVAELTMPLAKWERARRFVIIRETKKTCACGSQLAIDFKGVYEYEVIVTGMEDLPPEEIWRWYNKRCNVENKIDELKTGLAIDCASQHEMLRNKAFMWIKVLSYNLLNWFRLSLLLEDVSKCEITTLRRLILNVPGNVVGSGRYRHVRLAPNAWLKKTVAIIKARLKEFLSIRAWLLAVDTT